MPLFRHTADSSLVFYQQAVNRFFVSRLFSFGNTLCPGYYDGKLLNDVLPSPYCVSSLLYKLVGSSPGHVSRWIVMVFIFDVDGLPGVLSIVIRSAFRADMLVAGTACYKLKTNRHGVCY